MNVRIESNTGINFLYSDCIQSKLLQLDQRLDYEKSMTIKQLIDQDDPSYYRISVMIISDKEEVFKAGTGRDAHVLLATLLDSCMPEDDHTARLHSIAGSLPSVPMLQSAG